MYIYIHIYIYRERERYIDIDMEREIERERDRTMVTACDAESMEPRVTARDTTRLLGRGVYIYIYIYNATLHYMLLHYIIS